MGGQSIFSSRWRQHRNEVSHHLLKNATNETLLVGMFKVQVTLLWLEERFLGHR